MDLAVLVFGVDSKSVDSRIDEVLGPCCDARIFEHVTPPIKAIPHPRYSGIPPREHFGFRDGMSQPIIREILEGKGAKEQETFSRPNGRYFENNIVPAGEFIFGYHNAYQRMPLPPLVAPKPGSPLSRTVSGGESSRNSPQLDFGRDGSYMVIRQLRQEVVEFWQSIDAATRDPQGRSDAAARELLAAKIVGRWRNGAPLAEFPDSEPATPPDALNDFVFRDSDPHGYRCPIGAHIRRANPRDALDNHESPQRAMELVNRHRILRRGRPYGTWLPSINGPDDGAERGLMFVAFNVNIERQFEFIQNAWVNNDKFDGLYDENDPLIGALHDGASGGTFTIQAAPVRRRYHDLRRFVHVVGGGYFFLPSRPALVHLLL